MKSDQGEFLFVISFYYFVLAFLSSPSSFSSESHFQEGTAGIYIYIKKNLYGWRCLKVNNLASCWLVAALTVGEEEEEGGEPPPPQKKTALQIDTMACAPTEGEGTEAGREAKRRKTTTTNRGEISAISGSKWDGEGERKSHRPSFLSKNPFFYPPLCCLFRISGAKSTKLDADISERAWELLLNYYSKYCTYTLTTFTDIKILHFLEPFTPPAAFLGEEWDGLVSQIGCYSPISVRDSTEPRPLFWLSTLSHVLTRLYPQPNLK